MTSIRATRRSIINCRNCNLGGLAGIRPVPWRGPMPAPIAIVGEAPGINENRAGKPFIGQAGQVLSAALVDGGIHEDDCCILNTVCCYPAGTPTAQQQVACRPNLWAQLELADASYVLILGAVALAAFKPSEKISQVRSKWWNEDGCLYYPTWHPAATLYDVRKKREFLYDVRRFGQFTRSLATGGD